MTASLGWHVGGRFLGLLLNGNLEPRRISKRMLLLKDVSNRASSESGESAESAVTDSSPKGESHGKNLSTYSVKCVVSTPDAAAAATSLHLTKVSNSANPRSPETSAQLQERCVF